MKIIKQYFLKDGKNSPRAHCKIFIGCIKFMTQLALPLHSSLRWCVTTAGICCSCPSVSEAGR